MKREEKRFKDDVEWEKWKKAMDKYFSSEEGKEMLKKITGEISKRVRKQLIKEIGEGKLIKDEECKHCTYTIENGERKIYKHCKECRKELEDLIKGEEKYDSDFDAMIFCIACKKPIVLEVMEKYVFVDERGNSHRPLCKECYEKRSKGER